MPSQILDVLDARPAGSGLWYARTAPKTEGRGPVGILQLPFSGTSMVRPPARAANSGAPGGPTGPLCTPFQTPGTLSGLTQTR